MKGFGQLLKHDMYRQLLRHWYYFLIVIPFVWYFFDNLNSLIAMGGSEETAGFLELIIYFFYGEIEYIPQLSEFKVNIPFLLVHVMLAYIIAYYPVQDLSLRGRQVFIRLKGNTAWWYSKCLWLTTTVITYYVVIFLVVAIMTGGIRFSVREDIFLMLGEIQPGNTTRAYLTYCMLLPMAASLAISFLQMVISVMTAPVYGFCVVVLQLLLSFYFYAPWLPANYQMFNRLSLAREGGILAVPSFALCGGMVIVCVIVGAVYMKKRDIL